MSHMFPTKQIQGRIIIRMQHLVSKYRKSSKDSWTFELFNSHFSKFWRKMLFCSHLAKIGALVKHGGVLCRHFLESSVIKWPALALSSSWYRMLFTDMSTRRCGAPRCRVWIAWKVFVCKCWVRYRVRRWKGTPLSIYGCGHWLVEAMIKMAGIPFGHGSGAHTAGGGQVRSTKSSSVGGFPLLSRNWALLGSGTSESEGVANGRSKERWVARGSGNGIMASQTLKWNVCTRARYIGCNGFSPPVFCVRILRSWCDCMSVAIGTKTYPHEQLFHSSVNKIRPNSVVCLIL